jgi:hypothetical protein
MNLWHASNELHLTAAGLVAEKVVHPQVNKREAALIRGWGYRNLSDTSG